MGYGFLINYTIFVGDQTKNSMTTLRQFLTHKEYHRIKLEYTKTNHFEIKAKLNGIQGTFIVDTGASLLIC